MSMFDKYPNLPGSLTVYKDGGLQLKTDPNPPATQSLLLMGTAIDGPVGEPVAVDPTTASVLFGSSVNANGVPNGASLVAAFEEAYQAGCRDIRLLRFSGATAKASVAAPTVTEKKPEIEEAQLGAVAGNDETTFKLTTTPIVAGSVILRANGAVVNGGYDVDEATGDVVLDANKCTAGAALEVEYSCDQLVAEGTEEKAVTDNAGTLELDLAYDVHAVTSVKDGASITVAADQYSVVNGKIVFIAGAKDSGNTVLVAGRNLSVTYVGKSGTQLQVKENKNASGPFVAASSEQAFILKFQPMTGSFHLYSNGTEVLNSSAYRLDAANKKVYLKKNFFPKGALVSSSYSHEVDKTYTPAIEFETHFGGSVYNNTMVKVENVLDSSDVVIGKKIVITKPDSKKAQIAETPMEFTSADYPTFRQLVNAVNGAAKNNIIKAVTKYEGTATSDLVASPTSYFNGGHDGLDLNNEAVYEALAGKRNADGLLVTQGIFQYLEDYNVDNVVVKGIHLDTKLSGKFQNFAYDLAMFCAYLSYRNERTHGYISLEGPKDVKLGDISTFVNSALNIPNLWYMKDQSGNVIKDSEGNGVDIGQYISVVAGPALEIMIPSLGRTFTDGAVTLASFMTTLAPQSAPTNKELKSVLSTKYKLSNTHMDGLTGNRMITFKTKPNGGVYVVDGMSAAAPGSDYTRLTSIRVAKEASDNVREVCDPFIGEPNTVEQRNAMSSLIDKRLGLLKEKGIILDYEFQVISTLQDQLLGEAKIELTIVPPQELRKITQIVSLKPAL